MLDEVGREAPAGAPEQVGEAGGQLVGRDRLDAEVVEEVLAELELVELVAGHDDEQRGQRHLAGAQVPAEGEGRLRVRAAAR